MMMMRISKSARGLAAWGSLLLFTACGDLLDVADPQRYTSDDLDNALEAVAAGTEGDLHIAMDQYVIFQGLLSDELQHTGTWAGYDDIDHGRFTYGNNTRVRGTYNELLRVRTFAIQSEERFIRVLGESEAASSPLTAQVRTVGALADLLLGQAFCESPSGPSGPAIPAGQLLEQAIQKFTAAIETADAADTDDFRLINIAGRARAHMLLGNLAEAYNDAQQIPDDWIEYADFSMNSTRQDNDVVQLITAGNNTAAGLREKWWPMIDTDADMMLDPWTDEPDPRIPVLFEGELAVDGVTDHYSQWKYTELGSDIPLLDSQEMRLIEAEYHLIEEQNPVAALAILNQLRDDAGLTALADPGDADVVFDYLAHERFAELFMEGMRAADLRRWGLVADVFAAMNDSDRPASRPTAFPMDDFEARDNGNIEDDVSLRCLPMST